MKTLAWFRSVAAKFFHRAETSAAMDEELRAHIQLRADDLERSGLTHAEAERRAHIEFGGYEKFKEQTHEALGGNFIETFVQDVRFSLRVLRKSPGFTFAAVATLTLAISANAVVFGVLNAMILRPLNVPEPNSLYAIERGGYHDISQSYPDYRDLRDRNRTFEDLAAYDLAPAGLDTGKEITGAWIQETTGNYFDVLRIQPYLGRFFHSSDEHGPNSAPYIVLPWAYWHTHFQDDPGVVGRVVQLNKHPFTILGVAPQGFRGNLQFLSPDFWVPIVNQEQVEGVSVLNERGHRRRSEYDRRIARKELSKRRRLDDLFPHAPRPCGRLVREATEGISNWHDVAGGVNSAGRLRQPGQSVCSARCGPLP
jgi:hypothetical protein